MVEKGRILRAMNNALCDIDYTNFDRNQKLFMGLSQKVHYNALKRRVKISYQNYCSTNSDNTDMIATSVPYMGVASKDFNYNYRPLDNILKDLVTADDTHKATVNVLTGLCMNEGLQWDVAEDESKEEWLTELDDRIDLEELKNSILDMTIYGGSCLVKVAQIGEEYYIDLISNQSYFPVYSDYVTKKVIAYVEYMGIDIVNEDGTLQYPDTYYVRIHEENSIRHGIMNKDSTNLSFESMNQELIDYLGMEGNGVVEADNTIKEDKDDWTVFECVVKKPFKKVFGMSHFSEGSVSQSRDIVVATTIVGQNLDRVLKPLTVMDSSFLENTTTEVNGKQVTTKKLNAQDGILIANARQGDKPLFEQIKIDLKSDDVEKSIKQKTQQLYMSLGINETALGMSQKGQYSTVAKRTDMTITLGYARKYEKAANRALTKAINYIYKQITGQELNMTIRSSDMLTMSENEKLELIIKRKDNQLDTHANLIATANNISLEEATQKLKDIQDEELASVGEGFNDEDIEG